jgi:alpha-tubulin suppressor-like RCC1 family protein
MTGANIPNPPGWMIRSSPVQVGSDGDWSMIALSPAIYVGGGIRGGRLFVWGESYDGALGLGSTYLTSSPTQVGSATDWSFITFGYKTAFGIRAGKLYAWGANNSGVCGVGTNYGVVPSYSSPVQVGALTDWSFVNTGSYGAHAIRGGRLYGWGENFYGVIGNGVSPGSVDSYSSPVQIGADTDWVSVVNGAYSNYGMRKPGRIYAWGYNWIGQLGIGNLIDRSSPVQIGSAKDWTYLASNYASAGYSSVFGIRDGRLYAWGADGYGRLGLGTFGVARSSPVQVGSETDWVSASVGANHTIMVRRPPVP